MSQLAREAGEGEADLQGIQVEQGDKILKRPKDAQEGAILREMRGREGRRMAMP